MPIKKNKKGGASFAPFVTGFQKNMTDNLYLDNLEHQVLLNINVHLKSPFVLFLLYPIQN